MTFSQATLRHQGRPTPVIETGDRHWSLEEAAPGLLKGNHSRGLLNVFDDWDKTEHSPIALAGDLSAGRSKIAPLQAVNDDFLAPLQYPNKLI